MKNINKLFWLLLFFCIGCTCENYQLTENGIYAEDGFSSVINIDVDDYYNNIIKTYKIEIDNTQSAKLDSFHFYKSNPRFRVLVSDSSGEKRETFTIEPLKKYTIDISRGGDCASFNRTFKTDSLGRVHLK